MSTPSDIAPRSGTFDATRYTWDQYLKDTPTYGTYEERIPEYATVTAYLKSLGMKDDDLIVDVGAGSCDMDHYLRTVEGWRGKYLPIDGATLGVDFNKVPASVYLPNADADWYVCIETLEHVYHPDVLAHSMMLRATKGVIVTTPNAKSVDVLSVDPTHVTPIAQENLEFWGFTVVKTDFSGRGTPEEPDTLIGICNKQAIEEFPPAVKSR